MRLFVERGKVEGEHRINGFALCFESQCCCSSSSRIANIGGLFCWGSGYLSFSLRMKICRPARVMLPIAALRLWVCSNGSLWRGDV